MIIQWADHQDVYAALLARSAQRENRAVFGKRPAPASKRNPVWDRVLAAITDTPQTAADIANVTGMPIDTVRRHLGGLHSVGAICRSATTTAPRGGYAPAEWVKTKDTTK